MKKSILIIILLALFGCQSGQVGFSGSNDSEVTSVSLSVPSGSKMILTDPDNGQKKEFVLDSTQDIEFFVNKGAIPKNGIFELMLIIGSVFLCFIVLFSVLEFFKRRST